MRQAKVLNALARRELTRKELENRAIYFLDLAKKCISDFRYIPRADRGHSSGRRR